MMVSGCVIALVRGWLLTLVMLSLFPLLIGSMYFYTKVNYNKSQLEEEIYARAGGRAEEALSSIKTVKMLNG